MLVRSREQRSKLFSVNSFKFGEERLENGALFFCALRPARGSGLEEKQIRSFARNDQLHLRGMRPSGEFFFGPSQFVERGDQTRERKSNHVEVTAFDARNVAASAALDAVGACFVVGLLGSEVTRDFFGIEWGEMHQRAFYELAANDIGQSNEGDAGEHGMSAAGKLFEHEAGVVMRARLSEDVPIENHDRVCGNDYGRANGAGGNEIGFGVGQALDKFTGSFVREGSLVDRRREHRKRDASVAENFGAARGSRGENQFHGGLTDRILHGVCMHSCALVQIGERLELAGAAERSYRKGDEKQSDEQGKSD